MKSNKLIIKYFILLGILPTAVFSQQQTKESETNQLTRLLREDPKNFEKMKELIESEADVNAKGNNNWTFLHHAVSEGNLPMVEFLVEHGANVNLQTTVRNVLRLANGRNKVQIMESDDPTDTPLYLAVKRGDAEIARYLIEHGARNPRHDYYCFKPMHWAADKGDLEMVKVLVDNRAGIMQQDARYGNTPLHIAAEKGFKEIAEYILDSDKNHEAVNIENHKGETPLNVAKDPEMIKILQEHGGKYAPPKVWPKLDPSGKLGF